MSRTLRRMLVAFAALVAAIAAAQLWLFRSVQPVLDTIEYFEVADQIQRVGYAKALSLHWSPLYPLYLVTVRRLTGMSLERELSVTSAADVVLLVALCLIAAGVFASIGRLCFPDREDSARAWLAYACGLAIYFAFCVLRVGLRMPDALVTCWTLLIVWAWCRAMTRDLDLRWTAVAGLLSGVAFLTRDNLMHWSLVVGVAACVVAPGVRAGKRWMAYAVFAIGLLVFVGPQTYVLSTTRGHFTFGESGKGTFAETYGAVWPNGYPAWPVRVEHGDVRFFPESRDLNFPGFYEPGREYDDATIPFRWSSAVLAVLRSANATLFGYWSPAFALLWPLAWALWPALVFGVAVPWFGSPVATSGDARVRQRVSGFLVAAGSVGVAMHLVSFSLGYYLPPYLLPLLLGLYLAVMDGHLTDPILLRRCHRAAWIVGAGFVVVAVLTCATNLRRSFTRTVAAATADSRAIAAALSSLPAERGEFHRVAAAGMWLGVYGVRLSNSQITADIPDPEALHDPVRAAAVVRVLRAQGVVAILVPRSDTKRDDPLPWRALTSTWALIDLR